MSSVDEPVVYVVRHGQTVLNADHRFRGNADPPLDSVGIQQAHRLASLFQNIDVCCIVCSDKQRATKTAEIIASAKKLPINITSSLRALNVGKFSGQKRTPEAEAELGAYLTSPATPIPGGESLQDFHDRIAPCLNDAIELFMDTGVPPLLVAHSSIVHEVGTICQGDHKAVLVEPGGAIAVFFRNGKIQAQPIFKPVIRPAGSAAGTVS